MRLPRARAQGGALFRASSSLCRSWQPRRGPGDAPRGCSPSPSQSPSPLAQSGPTSPLPRVISQNPRAPLPPAPLESWPSTNLPSPLHVSRSEWLHCSAPTVCTYPPRQTQGPPVAPPRLPCVSLTPEYRTFSPGNFQEGPSIPWSCHHGSGSQAVGRQPVCQPAALPTQQSRRVHADSKGAPATDFPGAKTAFTPELRFVPERAEAPIPCFQVLDLAGNIVPGAEQYEVDKDLALDMYIKMVQLQTMDSVFYEAQRQGRFSFYMTTAGEEAINIASAAALSNLDHIFAQYREPGVLLWRGFTLRQFSNQCFGNVEDSTKGRQMPIHYGSRELRFQTISSPLTTQVPHAVGAAYGLKMSGEDCCAVTYFGEGAASEGDFHAALNFAAVLEAPVLFICRNNGWAISTPSNEQYKGDGIAGRGQAYGVRSIRVDGNDVLAVHASVKEARRQVVQEARPVLLEALTYRTGHHSTSDDSSRYRGAAELSHWKMERDPTKRFQRWLMRKGWWAEDEEAAVRKEARKEVIDALEAAEKLPKPALSELFTDVYDKVPPNLVEQHRKALEAARRNPSAYPNDVPLA